MDAVNRKKLFPELDQAALSDGRQQLLGGDGRRQFRVAQVLAPGGNRPGRDDDNTMPGGVLLRALAHQFDNMGAIQAAGAAGQDAGPQFHHQGLAVTHDVLPYQRNWKN